MPKQNSTAGFWIDMVDSTDKETGLAGLTLAFELGKNGAVPTVVAPTVTDRGKGRYWIEPIAAHRDTLGQNHWYITASAGGSPAPVSYVEDVTAADWEDVAKVPRATAAMAGGDNFTRNKVSEAANDMTENFS